MAVKSRVREVRKAQEHLLEQGAAQAACGVWWPTPGCGRWPPGSTPTPAGRRSPSAGTSRRLPGRAPAVPGLPAALRRARPGRRGLRQRAWPSPTPTASCCGCAAGLGCCARPRPSTSSRARSGTRAHAGTNAPGTALRLDAPVAIHSAEHFIRPVQHWSCAAAPIHDPGTARDPRRPRHHRRPDVGSPQTLAMVRAAARMAESELARLGAVGRCVAAPARGTPPGDRTARSLADPWRPGPARLRGDRWAAGCSGSARGTARSWSSWPWRRRPDRRRAGLQLYPRDQVVLDHAGRDGPAARLLGDQSWPRAPTGCLRSHARTGPRSARSHGRATWPRRCGCTAGRCCRQRGARRG